MRVSLPHYQGGLRLDISLVSLLCVFSSLFMRGVWFRRQTSLSLCYNMALCKTKTGVVGLKQAKIPVLCQ